MIKSELLTYSIIHIIPHRKIEIIENTDTSLIINFDVSGVS